jgi:hypothetical protein
MYTISPVPSAILCKNIYLCSLDVGDIYLLQTDSKGEFIRIPSGTSECRSVPTSWHAAPRLCCMPLFNYLAQVTPPSLTAQHFAEYDIQVADFVLQLLTLPGRAIASCPHCAEGRMRAFRRRLTHASQRSWLGRSRRYRRRCLRRLGYRRHVRRSRTGIRARVKWTTTICPNH